MIAFITLLLALALDLFLSDPPNPVHPVAGMGAFIRWASECAPARGPALQFLYGLRLTFGGLILFTLPITALELLMKPYPWIAVGVNAILLKSAFSLRHLLEAGYEVEKALESGDLPEARRAVSWHLVSRDTRSLSEGLVASATVESLAENLTDSFIAPLLAFAVGGIPLAWAYRFINTADAMIGYRDERYEYLGKFAARLDDLLNWIPARLAGVLIVLSAPFAGGDGRNAWHMMVAQHAHPASPNAGWPMSAAAGALGVRLEKVGQYELNGSATLPLPITILRARRLVLVAAVLGAVGCAALLAVGAK